MDLIAMSEAYILCPFHIDQQVTRERWLAYVNDSPHMTFCKPDMAERKRNEDFDSEWKAGEDRAILIHYSPDLIEVRDIYDDGPEVARVIAEDLGLDVISPDEAL